jgi:hypothetical protein
MGKQEDMKRVQGTAPGAFWRGCLKVLGAGLLMAATLFAQQTHTSATNFSADILGQPDTRPGTWGTAGAATWQIKFTPPPDKVVQVLRVYGDVVAWPRGKVEKGYFAGVLFGLQTSAPDGSTRGTLLADNCFLYLQDVVTEEGKRTPFDLRFDEVFLQPDNVLVVKVAVWLNDTSREIHIEPTFSVVYKFAGAKDGLLTNAAR